MNKKGDAGDSPIWTNVIYLIIVLIFFGVMVGFAYTQGDGAGMWEDFYAKEIAKVIDSSEPGTEVWIDVTNAVAVADRRGKSFSGIFNFDNKNNEVIVSLRANRGSSFQYFKDVSVVNWSIEVFAGEEPYNQLYFKIVERVK